MTSHTQITTSPVNWRPQARCGFAATYGWSKRGAEEPDAFSDPAGSKQNRRDCRGRGLGLPVRHTGAEHGRIWSRPASPRSRERMVRDAPGGLERKTGTASLSRRTPHRGPDYVADPE